MKLLREVCPDALQGSVCNEAQCKRKSHPIICHAFWNSKIDHVSIPLVDFISRGLFHPVLFSRLIFHLSHARSHPTTTICSTFGPHASQSSNKRNAIGAQSVRLDTISQISDDNLTRTERIERRHRGRDGHTIITFGRWGKIRRDRKKGIVGR